MKRVTNLILSIFISPECLINLAVFSVCYLEPDFFLELGNKIKSDQEVWKFLPTLTLGLSALAFKLSSKVRAPLENASNKVLYDWPLYQLLVDRVMVSLFFATLCSVIALIIWIFGSGLPSELVGAVFLGATSAVASTALLMLLAHQKLRELLEMYGG